MSENIHSVTCFGEAVEILFSKFGEKLNGLVVVERYPAPMNPYTGAPSISQQPIFCYQFFDVDQKNIGYYIPDVQGVSIIESGREYPIIDNTEFQNIRSQIEFLKSKQNCTCNAYQLENFGCVCGNK